MSAKKRRSRQQGDRSEQQSRSVPHLPGATSRLFLPLLLLAMIAGIVFLFRDFIFSDRMLYGSDVLTAAYQFRVFGKTYLLEHGRWPVWEPYIFGGLPFVDAMHSDIFYPTWMLRLIMPVARANGYVFCIHLLIAGVGMFSLIRSLGIGRLGAGISALAYMFSTSLVSFVLEGHDGRLVVASLLPAVLFFLHRGLTDKGRWNFVLSGGVVGLALISPHVQMAYYLGMAATFFLFAGLWHTWQKSHDPKKIGAFVVFFVVVAAVALSLAAVQFLPTYFYLQHSPRGGGGRGYEFATSWSMPPEETINLIAPSFSGLIERYWGRNYFKRHSEYLGIIPLVLAAAAVVLGRRKPYAKFFIGLAIFSLIMAFGGHTPLFRIAYYLIPRIKNFRAPSLIFFLFSFSVAALAGYGFDVFCSGSTAGTKRFLRGVAIGLGVVAVCLVICAAAREGVTERIAQSLAQSLAARYAPEIVRMKLQSFVANYSDFLMSLLRSLVLGGLVLSVLNLLFRQKMVPLTGFILLGLLLLFDQISVGSNFVRTVGPPDQFYAKDEVVRFLEQDKGLYRVYPVDYRVDDDYLMLFGIQNVGGHHGNQLLSYQKFIGGEGTVMFRGPNLQYRNFLDLLNVKYIIASARVPVSGLPAVHSGMAYNIYLNETALPRAFIVPDCRIVAEEDMVDLLRRGDFDPRAEVLLGEDPGFVSGSDETPVGEARITSYEPGRVVIFATVSHAAFLVLSDNYYPMWKATVDGSPAKIYRAYSTFRAVPLEAGSHTVVFTYDSIYLKIGFVLSSAASLLLVGACCVIVFQWQRRRGA